MGSRLEQGHDEGNDFYGIEALATDASLRGVWGRSPSAVCAIGDSGQIDLWDGKSWSACSVIDKADLRSIA